MATAVSLRKGTRTEHEKFKGDLGEVTFCTDDNPTLFIHLGDEKPGSPLAREDMLNVNVEDIAKRGIAKLDLTNVTIPSAQIETVKTNLNSLNYAQRDMSDVNAINLTKDGLHLGPDLARADSINTFTTNLAEGNSSNRNPELYGKNLAYSDMSNVDTADVVSTLTVDNEHLYADRDLGNINTADLATGAGTTGKHSGLNLAYANLSNIEILSETVKENLYNQGIQRTNNLTQNIDTGTTSEYPSAAAVRTKLDSISKLPNFNQLGNDDYQVLITSFVYSYTITKTTDGSIYTVNDVLTLVDENKASLGLTINVLSVETTGDTEAGEINQFEVLTPYGNVQLNGTYDTAVNLIAFSLLPVPTSSIEEKAYTISEEFVTTADFEIGAGTTEPANTIITCVNIGTELAPNFKWRILNNPTISTFTVNSTPTGVTPGPNTQVSWINLKNPITIRDTEMEDETGIITVRFSRNPTHVLIKKLIGGDIILGDPAVSSDGWSPLGITMTFVPKIPSDVLLDSWVITVEG